MGKYLFVGVLLATLFIGAAPVFAEQSVADLQSLQAQISQLLATIKSLQTELAAIKSGGSDSTGTAERRFCYNWTKNLRVGDSGQDIISLEKVLTDEGFLSGLPYSNYFGESTASAVVEFQEKYASEILTPNNLRRGTGFVGVSTRAKLNQLYGCNRPVPVTPPTNPPVTTYCPPDTTPSSGLPCVIRPTGQLLITVIHPQSGNILDNSGGKSSGLIANIQWTSSNTNNLPIEIDLLNSSGVIVKNIAQYLSNTGSYAWKYDSTIPNGTYDLLVGTQAKEGTPGSATGRSGQFTITGNNSTEPSITVLSPNGGESWQTGSKQTIRWNTNNILSTNNMTVRLRSTATGQELLTRYAPNFGYEIITIPADLAEGQYTAEVKTAVNNQSYLDSSDSYFTLTSSTATIPTPYIGSITPASGAVGTVVEIRGNNLAGFEGDLIAVFQRSDGKTVELNSIEPYWSGRIGDPVNRGLIKVKVEPPCQRGQTVYGAYSGIPSTCDYFEFTPGVYKVYVNPWGKKSNEVLFTVTSPTSTQPSLTVLSPNGGESWAKNTAQTIKWQDNIPFSMPYCPPNVACAQVFPQKYFDLRLYPIYTPPTCMTAPCPESIPPEPYTIATGVNVNNSSYDWNVGNAKDGLVRDGSYKIQVCQTGTDVCDFSDSYFKITSGSSTNSSPKIIGIPAIPTNIQPGQTVNFSWTATDADNDDLAWSVGWGDAGGASSCSSVRRQTGTGWNYNTSHAWAQAGTYQVKVSVSDCVGGVDSSSFSVQVGNLTSNRPPVINGLTAPTTLAVNQTGTWTVNAYDPENGTLSYSVNWGDTSSTPTSSGSVAILSPSFVQTSTFTHSYSTAGTYTTTFIVKDNAGLTAQTSTTVKVGDIERSVITYKVVTDKSTYTQDEKIQITIYATNNGNETKTLNWNSGCQVGYSVASFDSRVRQSCTMSPTSVAILPGATQSWTLTHDPVSYKIPAGQYKLQGIVLGFGEATTLITVTSSTQPSITVLSPNGGESWAKNTTQTIKWEDQVVCALWQGIPCAVPSYDIKLLPDAPSCTANICPAVIRAPYTIAKGIDGSSYNWSVGKISDTYSYGTGELAPDGAYTIQVCQTGTSTCDSSDSYFKIYSGSTQPSITVLSPNGEESWALSDFQKLIKWNYPSELNRFSSTVTIILVTPDRSKTWSIFQGIVGVVTTIPNQGEVPWSSLSSAPPGQYFINVNIADPITNKIYVGTSGLLTITAPTSTTQPSITNVSPTSNATMSPNSPVTISWNTNFPSGSTALLTVYLHSVTSVVNDVVLAKNLTNPATSASWSGNLIGYDGKNVAPDTYNVYVGGSVNGYNNIQGSSIGRITITAPTQPSITVLSPNGGESYTAGQPFDIKWSSAGITGGVSVDVMSADSSRVLISTSLTSNPGSYTFTSSASTISGQYIARIRAVNAGDSSDSSFTITAPASTGGDGGGIASTTSQSTAQMAGALEGVRLELQRMLQSLGR